MIATYIVKRQGKRPTEVFEREKLYASIVATCLTVQAPDGQAEATADSVCKAVMAWLEDKPEITSEDLRRKATEVLENYHTEAANLYKHHHMVI